jgi:hypothetical protein
MAEVSGAYKIAMQIVLTDVFKQQLGVNKDEDDYDEDNQKTATQNYVEGMIANTIAANVAKNL